MLSMFSTSSLGVGSHITSLPIWPRVGLYVASVPAVCAQPKEHSNRQLMAHAAPVF